MKSTKSICILFFMAIVTACSPFGRLYKEQPRVTLALPAGQRVNPLAVVKQDTLVHSTVNPDFIFVTATGDSVPVGVSAEWDSINKENISTVMMDEIVISSRSVRNTAERDGKINVEFVVTVPKELQAENWMVNIRPVLLKGDLPDSLRELRFTGSKFREQQERDYRRYDRFLENIIPDSVNFYHTFVNYHAFERYLERLKWYQRGLERRWAILDVKKRRPDQLLQRFDFFNKKAIRLDTLLKQRMQSDAYRMIDRQQWQYNQAWERMNDTVRYLNKYLPERFRFFNMRADRLTDKLRTRYHNKIEYQKLSMPGDSIRLWSNYVAKVARGNQKAEELIARKRYFYELALNSSVNSPYRQARYPGGVNPEIYYPRFIFFNEKMERLSAGLYMHYRIKGARAESGQGIKMLKALIAGKDTTSAYLNRSQLAEKYTKRYRKIKNFFPMYHFRRPEADTLPLSWIAGKADTVPTRRMLLSQFSEKDIYDYYQKQIRPDTLLLDPGSIRKQYSSRFNFLYNFLPVYTFRREIPDSVQRHIPSVKVVRDFKYSLFDSASTINYYTKRYEHFQAVYLQYRFMRRLYNINPPAMRYAARQEKIGKWIDRISSVDSASLVKMFYNTQKIARNEARKAMRDEKFRDIVRFPFNSEARLDTVIYAAGQVHFLYSENIQADENSSRMKVYLIGDVVSSTGTRYPLPLSDTLTYLVSSMMKFVDESPRYVRKIVTRDAEANVSVDFTFPKNKFKLDSKIETNREGLKKIYDLSLDLMTDPVYRIDSLTLFATSSPEGNWKINGEIARKRAESIRSVLERDFAMLYDSLAINTSVEVDASGKMIQRETADEIPNLPKLVKIRTIPEDWDKLTRLIIADRNFVGNKEAVLKLIWKENEPDRREYLIRIRYPKEYAYMYDKLYPLVRSVDFHFSLSRKGMRQDTLYTTEPDTTYARGMEYLKKRKYEQALEILRPYADRNTALAYMSLGYDKAALRIFETLPQLAEIKYLQAILQVRLGEEKKAVLLLLSAAEMDEKIKFRANLDPELSVLVKKYGLFQEDDF